MNSANHPKVEMHGPKMLQDSDRSWQIRYVVSSAQALSSHNERSGSLSCSRLKRSSRPSH